MSTTQTESALERQVREEQEAHDAAVARGEEYEVDESGDIDMTPDADTGQLLKMPRVAVIIEADPSALTLAFSGQFVIERGEKQWVELYNRLKAGKTAELRVGVHVAGTKTTHRRDKDGNVDAVMQTKSVIVTDLYLDEEIPD